MPTTAWRFLGTEGADNAVLKIKQLNDADLINVMDVAVMRWPEHSSSPITQEHVTEEGGKVAAMVHKMRHGAIDGQMLDTVKGDMRPGTSAMVLLSSNAEIDAVVHAAELRRFLVNATNKKMMTQTKRTILLFHHTEANAPDED